MKRVPTLIKKVVHFVEEASRIEAKINCLILPLDLTILSICADHRHHHNFIIVRASRHKVCAFRRAF